jgi:MOSC domain-containing protein YiiM
MARLLGIAIKPAGQKQLQLLNETQLCVDLGVVGDSRGQPGPRQVTLLSLASWREACDVVGVELNWLTRRANLLVDELPLIDSTGLQIVLGEARLEITGETDPCSVMEEAQPGLLKALAKQWRGGVACRVIQGGPIKSGMDVQLI